MTLKQSKSTRKPPMTDDQIGELSALLRDGLNITSAAKFLRIPLPTLEGWMRKYPMLRMAVDEAVAHHEHQMLHHATRHAQRDGKIAIALLERRFGHWNKADKREITADVTQTTVSPALLAALSAGKEERGTPPGGGLGYNQPTTENRE